MSEPTTEAGRDLLVFLSDALRVLARLYADARPSIDVERLARALQSTILVERETGPGMGAYRQFWDRLTPAQQRTVIRDAEALAAAYQSEETP